MKNIFVLLLLAFSIQTFAQGVENEKTDNFKITQKECIKKKGYQLVLKEIVLDSRCPEGVNCIWAGEIQVVVSVYKDKKFIEDNTITLTDKKDQENKKWFANYLPSDKKNIKSITVSPYPKKEVKINPKDYYINIGYVK